MLTQILNALSTTNESDENTNFSQFFCEYQLNSSDLKIDISGLGPIHFPITETDIQKLLNISDLAKFGLGEKTLQDTNIRNTHEISASKFNVQLNNPNIDKMLNEMRSAMGLSKNTRLTAHLHNMLIYGPGQFFKIHQDSEKLSNMVATLVIVLPSPHIGGDLLVYHNKKHHRFISENLKSQNLQCISFYADCRHEIEPVKQGYRVALTFNLVLESQGNEERQHNFQNKALEIALAEYFDIDQPATSTPLTLTYYLEHEYSEHGLKWELLKGSDTQNAFAFCCAAKNLGLKAHLALVELRESWTAESDYHDDAPDPGELIDDSADFTYWLDEHNQELLYENFRPSTDEICWTKDTKEFEPAETEYEGWMGNYGNTVDYWYRRAAIVLWREKDQIAMEFQLNYPAALVHLISLTQKPNHEIPVLDIIKKAGDHIYRSQYRTKSEDFLPFLDLACYIHDAEYAQFLLNRFSIIMISADCIGRMAQLQRLYGVDWCLVLFESWEKSKNNYPYNTKLLNKIDLLATEAINVGLDYKILLFLLKYQLKQMLESDRYAAKTSPLAQRNSATQRVEDSLALLRACFVFPDADEIVQEWITHLKSNADLYSVLEAADIYFSLQKTVPAPYQSPFVILREYTTKCITEELQKGLREADDWSIKINLKCRCEYCKILNNFLRSEIESKKIWPIVESHRLHVSEILRDLGLPVDVHVEQKGRPYKLVITKTEQLYQVAKKQFERLISYAKKLGIES